jgi:hypothetical protein
MKAPTAIQKHATFCKRARRAAHNVILLYERTGYQDIVLFEFNLRNEAVQYYHWFEWTECGWSCKNYVVWISIPSDGHNEIARGH